MPATDRSYMQRCLALAKKGEFSARPNPRVGCVIVSNGEIVGEGWHRCPGEAHAEVNALNAAGTAAHGATLYVSLEPCVHRGRTGPCSEAIIDAGIGRVVYGMIDPYPENAGKGIERLRSAGIEVDGPEMPEECSAVNPGFVKRMTRGLPYVRCKMAMSLDGRTATAGGESKWITGEAARADVQYWRALSSAVVTGSGTVCADDPSLNVRLEDYHGEQPLRVLVDSGLKTPADAKTLQLPGEVLVATAGEYSWPESRRVTAGVEVASFGNGDGSVDLAALMRYLAVTRECNEVLLEAGPRLAGAMLRAGLVDELIVYAAPMLLGDDGMPLFSLPGIRSMEDRLRLEFIDVLMLEEDCRMRARVIDSRESG